MVEGHKKEQWDHTAMLLAMIGNASPNRGAKTIQPSDLHPYLQDEQDKERVDDLGTIRHIFDKGMKNEDKIPE